MSEIQEPLQRHIDMLVHTGVEDGVQVTVYQDGVLIADVVAVEVTPTRTPRGESPSR